LILAIVIFALKELFNRFPKGKHAQGKAAEGSMKLIITTIFITLK